MVAGEWAGEDSGGVDAGLHIMGLLLTVLGTVYTAYPALRARRRAPMTRALVVGLAGGVTVALVATVLTLVALGLYALGRSAAVGSALRIALQVVPAAFGAGAVVGLLAGVASAARPGRPMSLRRNAVLVAVWLALVAAALIAAILGRDSLIIPLTAAIAAWSLVAGLLVAPPPAGRGLRAALTIGLPVAFLALAAGARLADTAGGAERAATAIVAAGLMVLGFTTSLAVPVFILCRPPASPDREGSAGRFLLGAAVGLAAAVVPASINAAVIHGDPTLATLAIGIGLLVAAINGEGRLLVHTPRARLAVVGGRVRLDAGVAWRRFRRGSLVGAVLSLQVLALTVAVGVLDPGFAGPGLQNPAALIVAAVVVGPAYVAPWALFVGTFNALFPLLVAKLERLPPERYIVPGIAMIAAGAVLVDSDALRRAVGL